MAFSCVFPYATSFKRMMKNKVSFSFNLDKNTYKNTLQPCPGSSVDESISLYAKAVGSIPSRGTDSNQPVNA